LTVSETTQVINGINFAERTFTDTGTPITVTGNGAGQTKGSGTNQVTWFRPVGTFDDSISLTMNAVTNVVNIESIDVNTAVFFGSGTQTNTVNIGNAGSLQGIKGGVDVIGPSAGLTNNSINVDDSKDSANNKVTISGTSIQGLAPTSISYQQSPNSPTSLDISGGNGNDTYTITNTLVNGPGFEEGSMTLNTGSGANAVDVQATSGLLAIVGNGGFDSVYMHSVVDGTLDSIKGSVQISDTAATTSLQLDDGNDGTSRTVSVTNTAVEGLSPASISFQPGGLSVLTVDTGSGAPDAITVSVSPFDKTPLKTTNLVLSAITGTEQLNVLGLAGNLNVAANDPTNAVVGSNPSGTGGTLANINGTVQFLPEFSTKLTVDDSGDAAPRTVNMTQLGSTILITGLAPTATIQYGGFGNSNTLTLNGGSGGNTFNVGETQFDQLSTTINGGKGGDTFNVTQTQTPLTLNTGAGSNHVNIQGVSDPIELGSAVLNVVGHGGNDTVIVGSKAPSLSGTQAKVFAAVNVSNTTNSTVLIVDDSGDTVSRTVTIGSNDIQFSGIGSSINFFAGIKSVEVFGGASARFVATPVAPSAQVILEGGSGTNTLVSGALNNTWFISGANAGRLQATIFFQNVQDLQGGVLLNEADTFLFGNGAGVTGTIVGPSGSGSVATLDYTPYTTPVTVNLKLDSATGVKGGVIGIRNVTGGQGNNILVGNGNNILRGGAGRDILLSGGGTSTLQAGSGEAILLGAHYLFDMDPAALNALMAEWSHTYDPINPLHDYQTRIAHLEHGGGLNGPFLLNPTTVVPQAGSTLLITGAQLDFLFSDPGDTLGKGLRPGEVDVFV
jgi:acrosin